MRVLSTLLALAVYASASRIVRFISDDGKIYTGDAILVNGSTDASKSTRARVIQGDVLKNFTVTSEIKTITHLLAPLAPQDTRTVRCVGFNYAHPRAASAKLEGYSIECPSKAHSVPIHFPELNRVDFAGSAGTATPPTHADEANVTIPDFPILFFKPWTALAPPNGQVPVTEGYQTQGNFTSEMDYEAELVVVISKQAYNISVDEALSVVSGFSVGYDVSHRGWQIARGGSPQPQYSMGKDADGWAPWGPAITTPDEISNVQNLSIWAKVNGVTKQNDTTANMLFGVAELVSFFSMGITLLPGDIIYTGTPSGVQLGQADPVWLVDGDVVEVGLEGLGTCTSTITNSNATTSAFDPVLGFTGVHGSHA
ncbi:hypothetical protein D9757_002031 [Collybiopsis confluens]|uniref:Fumarylacetoacetase-like C-terminal domain-containing protein n=1 Tax=Collybiopsis confluens TaxID=2823264 RepID=A0A8H5MEG4_9AGAR|nr:hypothetical protein D9757_002031 [Collybiopsis confluens]